MSVETSSSLVQYALYLILIPYTYMYIFSRAEGIFFSNLNILLVISIRAGRKNWAKLFLSAS